MKPKSQRDPAAVSLGKKRWSKKSKAERLEHALLMVKARKTKPSKD